MTEVPEIAVILSGGKGTRLFPNTLGVNKHLLPIYSKPMIYYPVALAMLVGIKRLIIVCNPDEERDFKKTLGFSQYCGMKIQTVVQKKAAGILDAVSNALPYVQQQKVLVLLGDNILFGSDLIRVIKNAFESNVMCHAFSFDVKDPSRFGVVLRDSREIKEIVEKPTQFLSTEAIVGLYVMDVEFLNNRIADINPSTRGELEVTSILQLALREKSLKITKLPRGIFWVDAGLVSDLSIASEYVKSYEERVGKLIYCPEEIAYNRGWIDKNQLVTLANQYPACEYQDYLKWLCHN